MTADAFAAVLLIVIFFGLTLFGLEKFTKVAQWSRLNKFQSVRWFAARWRAIGP